MVCNDDNSNYKQQIHENSEELIKMRKLIDTEFKDFKKSIVKKSVSSMAAAYRLRKQNKTTQNEEDD